MSAIAIFPERNRAIESVVRGQIQAAKQRIAFFEMFTVGEKVGCLIDGIRRLIDCVEMLAGDCDPAHLGSVLDCMSATNDELTQVFNALERSRLREAELWARERAAVEPKALEASPEGK
jgi:hypothetical protein